MDGVLLAFQLIFDPYVLVVVLLSALFGLFMGAIPGLTATIATALLVPVTFFMPPVPALAAIVTATAMAIFAGDIPSTLLRIPGTPASAAYTDEAYDMTRKGDAELTVAVRRWTSLRGRPCHGHPGRAPRRLARRAPVTRGVVPSARRWNTARAGRSEAGAVEGLYVLG